MTRRIALLKPETFMNDSGRSLAAARAFFKVPVEQILVVHDDVDLETGRLQIRARRRSCGPQRPALDREGPRLAGLPAAADRCRPARPRRPSPRRRLRPLPVRSRGERRGHRRPLGRRLRVAGRGRARNRPNARSTSPVARAGTRAAGRPVASVIGAARIAPRDAFPARRMDPTPLSAFVDELAAHERFRSFAEALPARARVSEPVLALVLATLHRELARPLLLLLPDDADARTRPRACRGSSARTMLRCCRAAGSPTDRVSSPRHISSGSDSAPSTCSPAAASSARPRAPSPTAAARERASAGDRARSRRRARCGGPGRSAGPRGVRPGGACRGAGAFAIRGGIVDVFPSTGREPLRVELFGDEIEQVRAFSPFTQRALHPLERALDLPGGGAPRRPHRAFAAARGRRAVAQSQLAGDLVSPVDRPPDLVWEPDDVRRVWEEEGLAPLDLSAGLRARPLPARPAVRIRGATPSDRRPRSRRGRDRAAGVHPGRAPRRRRVPTPRRGSAPEGATAQGRAGDARDRRRAPEGRRSSLRRLTGAPRLRLARARSRAASRTARSSASDRRVPTPASGAHSRRSPTCARATTSSTRITASGSCSASRRRRSPASRGTISSSPSAATTASISRTSSSASSRSTSEPTRKRRSSPSSEARPGRT